MDIRKFECLRHFAAALFALLLFGSTLSAAKEAIETKRPNLDVMKIAHRGAAKYAPENTIPAIEKAIELGFDYVEADIRYTKDGVPILMHDPSAFRTANVKGPVSDYTLEEIKKLDAGYSSQFGDKYKGTSVPTLEEALQVMQGRIKLYLDQKEMPRPIQIELLKKYEFIPDNMVIVGGIEREKEFEELSPGAPIMTGVSSVDQIPALVAKFPDLKAFNTAAYSLQKEVVDEAHRHGIMIFTNTLGWGDTGTYMQRAIEMGVDAIQTDHPIVLLKTIKKMKRKHQKENKKTDQ